MNPTSSLPRRAELKILHVEDGSPQADRLHAKLFPPFSFDRVPTDPRTLTVLLELGVRPGLLNSDGKSLLDVAVSNDQAGAVKELLAWGANPLLEPENGWSPALESAAAGVEVFDTMVAHPGALTARSSGGATLLHRAARHGGVRRIVRLL